MNEWTTVTLDIAGGLAPPMMNRHYVVEASRLEQTERQALGTLIDEVLEGPDRKEDRALRDARSYEIGITIGTEQRTVVAYDGSVRPAIRKLVESIVALAQPRK